MAFKMNHIHLKTPDPKRTAQFYVDALGATIVGEIGDTGLRLDLHGLAINLTKFIDSQTRNQIYGIEHIAVSTDDMDNVLADLKASGARTLEQRLIGEERRVCFLEGPDGVQLELIESPS